jgi:chromosome segregation ATPase
MELDSSKSSAQTLQHELDVVHKQENVLKQQVIYLQMEAKSLSETLGHVREDKLKLEAELEDQRRRNSSLELASDSHFSFLCIKCERKGINCFIYTGICAEIINWYLFYFVTLVQIFYCLKL